MEKIVQEVVEWMVQEIKFIGILKQEVVIEYVKIYFGDEFVFVNENGNVFLFKEVKKVF